MAIQKLIETYEKTGKPVVSPLNAKNVLGLQSGEDIDLDSEEAK